MTNILPTPQEAVELVPRRDGPVWSRASDARLFATAGYALLLQVAHPTVGAGVEQFSNFQQDPYGRLFRTLDYVNASIYGGPQLASEVGRRVRDMHKHIKGTLPDGTPYHSLEPSAYAWVHATLASSLIDGHRVFGTPMDAATAQAFWTEWLALGRLIGVRERDLPAAWADFPAYFDAMVDTQLCDNGAVHQVLTALTRPSKPPVPLLTSRAWRLLRRPPAYVQYRITVGMLPPALRGKLNLAWSARDERIFRAIAWASRASRPLIRGPLAQFGPHYLRARKQALTRGDVARPRPVVEQKLAA